MSDKINQAVEAADAVIMELCQPKHMSQSQAIDFLEGVIDRCRSAIEALREEMLEDE